MDHFYDNFVAFLSRWSLAATALIYFHYIEKNNLDIQLLCRIVIWFLTSVRKDDNIFIFE